MNSNNINETKFLQVHTIPKVTSYETIQLTLEKDLNLVHSNSIEEHKIINSYFMAIYIIQDNIANERLVNSVIEYSNLLNLKTGEYNTELLKRLLDNLNLKDSNCVIC
ncbi:MAG: hypothetical protein ACK5Z5_08300 [Neisseriaceae bacterium]